MKTGMTEMKNVKTETEIQATEMIKELTETLENAFFSEKRPFLP